MSAFSSTDELYEVMCELWDHIKADPFMAEKLLQTRLVVRFNYQDPDGNLTIDASDGENIKVSPDSCDVEPDIEMSMKSDLAHNFWMGKVNPNIALLHGKISSRGPVNKALALLPAVKPAFEVYPSIVEGITGSSA